LANSGPDILAVSAEHHPDQPAHASLRFDGGQGPDRGAILHTAPNAPLNSATFLGGYTIEVFFKLPDPFVGDHAWMGLLSWEGRSGDAGKHSGWSPLETTCSLNISPERFLQYVVYPADRDADPTSWSHTLPVGREPGGALPRHRHPGPPLRARRDLFRPAVRPGLLRLAG
jgi:hypothetical protein